MIPVMLGIEEPMKIKDDFDAENGMTITREELEEMDGFDDAPLYLSIKRRVYDVSAGQRFYGEGKDYHEWTGKDASRSFGTGCRGGIDRTGMDCLSESLEGLTGKVSLWVFLKMILQRFLVQFLQAISLVWKNVISVELRMNEGIERD